MVEVNIIASVRELNRAVQSTQTQASRKRVAGGDIT
jgi:hypothetical protein